MVKKSKAHVSEETFDELLAEQGMLGTCEERAIKEIIAEQPAEAMKSAGHHQERNGGTNENQPAPA